MGMLLKRRDILIQRIQHLNLSENSYLKYVKTINDTFQILKRTIEPYYYADNGCIYDNHEASHIQGNCFQEKLFITNSYYHRFKFYTT
jgi:hypothetical protein